MQHGEKQLTDTSENVLKRLFIDNLGYLGWSQSAVDAEEVCGETSNVRSGHGTSREHLGLPIIPSGYDINAGSVDINEGTIIGGGGHCILECRSGDGNRLPNAGRRVVLHVIVIAPCGYDDGDTAVVKLKMESLVSGVAITFHTLSAYRYDSRVQGGRSTPTQAYRGNRGFSCPFCFLGDPVDTGDTVAQ